MKSSSPIRRGASVCLDGLDIESFSEKEPSSASSNEESSSQEEDELEMEKPVDIELKYSDLVAGIDDISSEFRNIINKYNTIYDNIDVEKHSKNYNQQKIDYFYNQQHENNIRLHNFICKIKNNTSPLTTDEIANVQLSALIEGNSNNNKLSEYAKCKISCLYRDGLIVEKDLDKSNDIFRKALDYDNPEYFVDLAWTKNTLNQTDETILCYLKAYMLLSSNSNTLPIREARVRKSIIDTCRAAIEYEAPKPDEQSYIKKALYQALILQLDDQKSMSYESEKDKFKQIYAFQKAQSKGQLPKVKACIKILIHTCTKDILPFYNNALAKFLYYAYSKTTKEANISEEIKEKENKSASKSLDVIKEENEQPAQNCKIQIAKTPETSLNSPSSIVVSGNLLGTRK